jgi:hypothetical protein
MNSNKLNRATNYLKCVKTHCEPKKTKRFRKCSKKVECGDNIEPLQDCIDGVKLESMKKVVGNNVRGEYNNPLNIMKNQVRGVYVTHQPKKNLGIYHVGKTQNNGTYTSIKPKASEPNYVDMNGVKDPERSAAEYVTMKKQKRPVPAPRTKRLKPKRPPAPLPRRSPSRNSSKKKSSPHIHARVRKTRTNTKNSPNFYGPTQRQGKRQGSPLKPIGAKKPKIPKKPSKLSRGRVAELRKVFEPKTKK